MSSAENQQSRGVRRRIAREGAADAKLMTQKEVRILLDKYHTLMVTPRIEFLEEYVFYKKMWPHQRVYYHWLNFKSWCKARWRAFGKWRYVQRWHKANDKVNTDEA